MLPACLSHQEKHITTWITPWCMGASQSAIRLSRQMCARVRGLDELPVWLDAHNDAQALMTQHVAMCRWRYWCMWCQRCLTSIPPCHRTWRPRSGAAALASSSRCAFQHFIDEIWRFHNINWYMWVNCRFHGQASAAHIVCYGSFYPCTPTRRYKCFSCGQSSCHNQSVCGHF